MSLVGSLTQQMVHRQMAHRGIVTQSYKALNILMQFQKHKQLCLRDFSYAVSYNSSMCVWLYSHS